MPAIKISNVVSFSSEDRNHPAENILKSDGTHKWKCASAGEKTVSIILQFDKPEKIQSIDIGNESSAFIEVLVGRISTSASDEAYQVLLVASSFMTPMESRNGTNRNCVRMFGLDKLSKTSVDQKWDRVKIVCTQPFNKTTTFGLSFIKFHSTPNVSSEPSVKKTLGAFTLREDSDPAVIAVGALFASRDHHRPEAPPATGAAAVRAASKVAELAYSAMKQNKPPPSHQPVQSNHKRRHSNDEPNGSEKKNRTSQSDSRVTEKTPKPATPKASTSHQERRPKPDKRSAEVPLTSVMTGVVFVMSGYQNPERADIRDKAVEMGATYKPDWSDSCTHLICAFTNTPKFTAVRGKGRIVGKAWITDSYKQKMLLPWRKFRVGSAESPGNSADECGPSVTPPASKPRQPPHRDDRSNRGGVSSDSADDTGDELERLKETSTKKTPLAPKDTPDYEVSTDEDAPDKGDISETGSNDSGLPYLPDFFTDKTFFLFGDFSPAERRALLRYITAYNGHVDNYMTGKVTFVLTYSPWDDQFEEALKTNPSLTFVKPKWVYACSEASKLVPFQPFVVVPQP